MGTGMQDRHKDERHGYEGARQRCKTRVLDMGARVQNKGTTH